jgi:hypothetical protein
LSASNYDNSNPDQLLKSIPEYLREDPANQPYDLFVDMVAQYYDNVWLYISEKYTWIWLYLFSLILLLTGNN